MFVIRYVVSHFVMLMELVGLWVMLDVGVHVSKRTIRMTRMTLLLLLLDSVLYELEVWTHTFETLSIWRPILTAAIYSLQPFVILSIMQMTAPLRKRFYWLLLPGLICVPVYFSSQWTHLVCWFQESNVYSDGPLSWLPYFVFGFYLLVFFVQYFRTYKKYSVRDRLSVCFIALMAMFGVILYIVIDFSNDYSAIFAAVVLLYYLFIYIHVAKADALTGLMNRQCFYRDSQTRAGRITCVASVDMNGLKWLNDTKGHDAGDRALKAVAECLAGCGMEHKTVYRVGGDEFVIFYYDLTEEKVIQDIDHMREAMSKTEYVCAYGYCMKQDGVSVEETLRVADQAMYDDKAKLKRMADEQGVQLHFRE